MICASGGPRRRVELAMSLRVTTCFRVSAIFLFSAFLSHMVLAQRPTSSSGAGNRPGAGSSALEGGDPTIDIDIYVKGADGSPIEVTAMVTLVGPTGQMVSQGTTLGGNIQFKGVAATEYTIQVVAPGYENAAKEYDGYNAGGRVLIDMLPASNGGGGAGSSKILLAPKVQKELAKAMEALRANKLEEARSHLDAAHKKAPNHPAVNYLFGVYSVQLKDLEKAKSYWNKALEFDPKHSPSLLALSEVLMREQKLPEAETYGKRAVESEPSSWRAHAILANVFLREHIPQESIKEADRALELSHGQAAGVQPVLARALVESGNKDRAKKILQEYVPDHPNDGAARKQLEDLQLPPASAPSVQAVALGTGPAPATEAAIALPLSSDAVNLEGEYGNGAPEVSPVTPKAQEALDKAFKLLGPDATPEQVAWARNHLETAYKIAPTSADVNYLFGVYWWQTRDVARAISYWKKAIGFYPEHYRALLSLGQALVDKDKPMEALPYLERAAQAEPFSWRPYVLLTHTYLRQGLFDRAVSGAERALELGQEEAAIAQRYLSAAYAKRGEKDKAARVLQAYVQNHRADGGAKKQLEMLEEPGRNAQDSAEASSQELLQSVAIATVTPLPLPPAKWFPPDVDEKVPAVEEGTACSLGQVLQKTGMRVEEFVRNVDRFTASEFLKHESIDKWGFAGIPETRKYNYVASIQEYGPGRFNVNEYRGGVRSLAEFPDGVATNGLPALALIFHPNNAGNFEMNCEGLSQSKGKLAWQVHFRQRADKPNTMREYRIGEEGPAYPVALRGRAWIAADSYQIVRMETDLVAPVPQIRLLADHTAVEYGPVHFQKKNVEMWLPQGAELYSDWKGHRMHRRLSFSNYMLFSVDEKQKISPPKGETENQQKADTGPQN